MSGLDEAQHDAGHRSRPGDGGARADKLPSASGGGPARSKRRLPPSWERAISSAEGAILDLDRLAPAPRAALERALRATTVKVASSSISFVTSDGKEEFREELRARVAAAMVRTCRDIDVRGHDPAGMRSALLAAAVELGPRASTVELVREDLQRAGVVPPGPERPVDDALLAAVFDGDRGPASLQHLLFNIDDAGKVRVADEARRRLARSLPLAPSELTTVAGWHPAAQEALRCLSVLLDVDPRSALYEALDAMASCRNWSVAGMSAIVAARASATLDGMLGKEVHDALLRESRTWQELMAEHDRGAQPEPSEVRPEQLLEQLLDHDRWRQIEAYDVARKVCDIVEEVRSRPELDPWRPGMMGPPRPVEPVAGPSVAAARDAIVAALRLGLDDVVVPAVEFLVAIEHPAASDELASIVGDVPSERRDAMVAALVDSLERATSSVESTDYAAGRPHAERIARSLLMLVELDEQCATRVVTGLLSRDRALLVAAAGPVLGTLLHRGCDGPDAVAASRLRSQVRRWIYRGQEQGGLQLLARHLEAALAPSEERLRAAASVRGDAADLGMAGLGGAPLRARRRGAASSEVDEGEVVRVERGPGDRSDPPPASTADVRKGRRGSGGRRPGSLDL